LEHAPGDRDHAVVLADLDPNSIACRAASQRASSGKVKNIGVSGSAPASDDVL
jgi:hypothetical protein